MIGIPNKIKLKELARHFTEAGIPVEKRDSLPDRYAEGFKPLITVAMAIVGVVLLSVGLGFYFERVPGPGNQIAVREQAPDFPQDIPQFPNPAQAIPNPLAPAPIARNNQPTEKENISAPPTGTPNFAPPNLRSEGPGPFKDRFPDRMLSRPGRPPAQPGPPTPEPENSIPTPNGKGVGNANDSKLIGNSEGGVPFRMVNGEGKTLRGFQYSMGSWAGEPALRNLIPLYDRTGSRGRNTAIVAKEGYAVGGLKIDAPKYVSAVQIIFQRIKPDGQLDPADAYTSEWIGTPSEKEAPIVDGAGKKAIGIHGRRGAIIDAVGLVFE